MKSLNTIFFLILSVAVFAQPCEFSWARVINPGGSQSNFLDATETQPFIGPCMSFSFTAAIEAVARIEKDDPNYQINLSVPYFDALLWGEYPPEIKRLLEGGLLLTEPICGNFPYGCDDEQNCRVISKNSVSSRLRLNNRECFTITGEPAKTNGPPSEHEADTYEVSYSDGLANKWYGVESVRRHESFSSPEAIKNLITNHGPLVLYIPVEYMRRFRDYTYQPGDVSFHSFIIIGWRDVPDGTEWLGRDSWQGLDSDFYSKPNPNLKDLINDNYVLAYTISGVYESDGLKFSQYPEFNLEDQCVTDATIIPTVEKLYVAGTTKQNEWSTLIGKASCDVAVDSWQFQITASRTKPKREWNCLGEMDFSPYVDQTIRLGARVKSVSGLWSNWKYIYVDIQPGQKNNLGPIFSPW